MGIKVIECTSASGMFEACQREAVTMRGAHPVVDVLVASSDVEVLLKKKLAKEGAIGIGVSTLEHWLDSQWELWGDGSRLVSRQQRQLLLRPALAKLAQLDPSSAYIESFASFVQDALALGARPQDEQMVCTLEDYLERLGKAGLTDPFAVLDELASANAGKAIVFAGLDMTVARVAQLAKKLAATAELTVLQRCLPLGNLDDDGTLADGELACMRSTLFSGKEGLVPTGGFKAVEVLGIHAENAAVVSLVKDAIDSGVDAGDIVVAFPSLAQLPASLPQALALAGIPVECRLSSTVRQTAFGSALLQLEALLGDADDGFANSAAFASSDYSGIDEQTARGLCATWRTQAGSTHEARLADLTRGFKGRVSSKIWVGKLERVRALLEQPALAGRISLMFDNACALAFDEERLADDAAVAHAVLDYLDTCEGLGMEPSLLDIAELSVALFRSSEGEESRVRIVPAAALSALESVSYVVFARLDKGSYPMAVPPGPFERYLDEMGFAARPATALNARVLLLDALERSSKGFACYRLATDAEGSDSCQSALWDELMTAYRSEADADVPVHALPSSLMEAGYGMRLAEADVFTGTVAEEAARFDVSRGSVDSAASGLLFPDFENYNETFSPTAIEDYYRCPYRWFICRRVGANPIDKPFDQIAKGNLAHAVFERFYLDLREEGIERVTEDNLALCLEIANRSFDWQLAHEIERHRLNLMSARDYQEVGVVRTQVLDLVRRDACFLPGFTPTYLELKLEDAQGAPLMYAGVAVRGKVDRIDVDEQGRAVVIDYKLSGLGSGYGLPKEEGLPTRIQTDIYATLVQRCLREQAAELTVVGSVYRSYAKNMLRGVYAEGIDWGSAEIVRSSNDALPGGAHLESYPEYLERVESTVEGLMRKMREGDIAPRPLCDDACEHCLAAGFCVERRGK